MSASITKRWLLTPAERRAKAKAALIASLTPRKQGGINHPINAGPLRVTRGTGAFALV